MTDTSAIIDRAEDFLEMGWSPDPAAVALIRDLTTALTRLSERTEERFRQMEERELLGGDIAQAMVDQMKARALAADVRLAEADEIITGLIVLERGSGERALAYLQRYSAAVSSPVTEKTDG